jgi:cobalt-zinc-cadmium resistance protein CzcA
VQRVLGLPLLNVKADRLRLARYGIPADEVLSVVEASRVGRSVGKIFEGPRRFDLVLLLPPAQLTPESFGELMVGTGQGQLVPLAQVADIRESEGPAVINREGLERRVMVEANIRGRDLVSYVTEAQQKVESAQITVTGYRLRLGWSVRELHPRQESLDVGGSGGAGDHLWNAVPDVRGPSLRDLGVRVCAAGGRGRSDGAARCEVCRFRFLRR